MQMLSGAPEVIMVTWILLACLLAASLKREDGIWWRHSGRFAMLVALVAGLSAIQLLPFVGLLAHSQRNANFADSEWSMPLWGWANFFVPLFGTGPTELGIRSQPGQYWVYSYYLGIGAVFLALMAAWQVRQRRVRMLAAMSLISLVLALGNKGFAYKFLRELFPAVGFMRYPVKFVLFPAFTVPLLAGCCIAGLSAVPADVTHRQSRKLLWLGGITAAAIGGIVLAAHQFRFPYTPWSMVAVGGSTRLVVLAALVAMLLAMPRVSRPRLQLLLRFTVLAALWLDTLSMGPRPAPSVSMAAYQPGLVRRKISMNGIPRLGHSRAMLHRAAENAMDYVQFPDAMRTVLYSRLALYDDDNLMDGIPKLVGMYSLQLPNTDAALRALFKPASPPAGLADFLGVSQINVPGRAMEWTARPSHLPWVTGGQRPVFATDKEALAALGSTNFNPRTTVYLPANLRGTLAVTNVSKPDIRVLEFSAERVRLRAESSKPALIVIAQSYYHDWKPFVDGKPARLLRANVGFQAVEIGPGLHQVTLLYKDRTLQIGALISGLFLVLAGLLWICD